MTRRATRSARAASSMSSSSSSSLRRRPRQRRRRVVTRARAQSAASRREDRFRGRGRRRQRAHAAQWCEPGAAQQLQLASARRQRAPRARDASTRLGRRRLSSRGSSSSLVVDARPPRHGLAAVVVLAHARVDRAGGVRLDQLEQQRLGRWPCADTPTRRAASLGSWACRAARSRARRRTASGEARRAIGTRATARARTGPRFRGVARGRRGRAATRAPRERDGTPHLAADVEADGGRIGRLAIHDRGRPPRHARGSRSARPCVRACAAHCRAGRRGARRALRGRRRAKT